MRRNVRTVIILAAFAAVNVWATDYYVAQNGQTPEFPYTSSGTAASNIQYAVNAVPVGAGSAQHTVWVGPGYYTASTNATTYGDSNTNVVTILDKAIILRASNTNPVLTIIDGGGKYRGIRAHCNRETTNRIVIDGFTVSNCFVNNSGGGGVLMDGFSHGWTGMVMNCVITDNKMAGTTGGGAGLYGKGIGDNGSGISFTLIVSNCVIRNNSSSGGSGGGVFGTASYLGGNMMRVVRCLIDNNYALHSGGGLYSNFADLENCEVRNNRAGNYGGGIYHSGAYVSLKNTLLCNNVAGYGGGAVYYQNSTERLGDELALDNCTVVSNSAGSYGAIRLQNNQTIGQVSIRNSIVYSNATVDFYNLPNMTNITLTTSCTSNTNGFPGFGNTTNSPKFKDFAGQNFRLAGTSPCIDTGTYQSWMGNALDLDGFRRLDATTGQVDMGCYEYRYAGTILTIR